MLNKYKIEFNHQYPEKWSREQWMKVVVELKSTIAPESMFTLMEAANFVGHKFDLPDEAIIELGNAMMRAVGKDLIVRHPATKLPYVPDDKVRWYFEQVRADELDEWFESKNVKYSIQHPWTNNSEILKSEPVSVRTGITKQQAINAFEGLHFDCDGWNNALSDVPKWIVECRVSRGRKGDKSTSAMWNPVLIAAALFEKNIPIKKLDTVFVRLKDWTDEWQEASALFRD